jgi:hypothetical protein
MIKKKFSGKELLRLFSVAFLVMLFAAVTSVQSFAQPRQPLGLLGLKAGSYPKFPGLYYTQLDSHVKQSDLVDSDGNKKDMQFNFEAYVSSQTFIWVTPKKILGGNYSARLVLPILLSQNTTLKDGKFLDVDETVSGLNDIELNPFQLSWHKEKFDARFGVVFTLPTGKYNKDNVAKSIGKNYYTTMFEAGFTYYPDNDKKWSIAVLGQYETNSKDTDHDITYGDDFFVSFGVGRKLDNNFTVGVSGYGAWQVTDDSRSTFTSNKKDHDKVFAVGPEVQWFFPKSGWTVKMKYAKEFGAVDRSEGQQLRFGFSKKIF